MGSSGLLDLHPQARLINHSVLPCGISLSRVNTRRVSYLCYTSCEYHYSLAVIPTVEHGLAVKLCYDGETMVLAI